MNHIAIWCVLIAGLLPYLATVISKMADRKNFDNYNPRIWQAKMTGLAARAHAAQLNSFEAFAFFAAAVLFALVQNHSSTWLNTFAVLFVVARVAYLACYLSNRATLRSLTWFVGFACVIAIFLLALL